MSPDEIRPHADADVEPFGGSPVVLHVNAVIAVPHRKPFYRGGIYESPVESLSFSDLILKLNLRKARSRHDPLFVNEAIIHIVADIVIVETGSQEDSGLELVRAAPVLYVARHVRAEDEHGRWPDVEGLYVAPIPDVTGSSDDSAVDEGIGVKPQREPASRQGVQRGLVSPALVIVRDVDLRGRVGAPYRCQLCAEQAPANRR